MKCSEFYLHSIYQYIKTIYPQFEYIWPNIGEVMSILKSQYSVKKVALEPRGQSTCHKGWWRRLVDTAVQEVRCTELHVCSCKKLQKSENKCRGGQYCIFLCFAVLVLLSTSCCQQVYVILFPSPRPLFGPISPNFKG